MGFETLSNLWLLLLAVPLVIFYFLKLKRPRMKIPSLFLWRQVINDSRVNSPFQRFKRHLLLLLQLLILGLLVFSAARPYFSGASGRGGMAPLLIDCSASMGAVDPATKKNRLQTAKEKVGTLIRNKAPAQKYSIISFSRTAVKKCDFTDNARILLDALDRISVEDVPGNLEDALRLVQALSRDCAFGEVLLYSDGNFPEKSDFNLPFKITFNRITDQGRNIGISGLNAKGTGEGGWAVFAEVVRSSPDVGAKLEFYRDGVLAGSEVIPAGGEDSARLSFEIGGEKECLVEMKILPEGFDSLESDNCASMNLVAGRKLSAYASPGLAAVNAALRGIVAVKMLDSPTVLPPPDLIAADNPSDIKDGCRTVMTSGFVPERLKGLIALEEKPGGVTDWERKDPLLDHAELSEIIISENPRFKTDSRENFAELERLGYETVAHGAEAPLIVKRAWAGQIYYHLLFSIEKTTLPYRVAFPVIISNLVGMAMSQAGLAEARAVATGILPEIQVGSEAVCEVNGPGGMRMQEKAGANGFLSGIPAMRAGKYEISSGGAKCAEIYAALLSARESKLAGTDKIQFKELSVSADKNPAKSQRTLWKILAALAFAFLFVEWWVFNKPPAGMRTR